MASHDQSFDEAPLREFPVAPVGKLTEEEFVAWCNEDTRAEWVNGKVVVMSPANREHALLAAWLLRLIGDYVERHQLGEVLFEYQVRLANQARRRVPDLVCLYNGHS